MATPATVAPRRRPQRPQSIPLADAAGLRPFVRRTGLVRFGLALALAGLLFATVAFAWESDPRPQRSIFADGESGVIVVDMSASVGSNAHERSSLALNHIAKLGRTFGLVFFSDTAYEGVPPGTSAAELKPFMRFFGRSRPTPCPSFRPSSCPPGTRPLSPEEFRREIRRRSRPDSTPWSGAFRGGTRISEGLRVARAILEREGGMSQGVLLISDLDDSLFDVPQLTRTLIEFTRDSIPVRVVGLSPNKDDRRYFERLVGEQAFVKRAEMAAGEPQALRRQEPSAKSGFPWALVLSGAGLLLLLGLNEHACGRLTWRRRPSEVTSP